MTITRVALALVLLSGAAACSSSSNKATPNPTPAPSQGSPSSQATGTGSVHQVAELPGKVFSPTDLTLKVGDSVHVTDRDPGVPHNFTVANVGHSDTMSEGDTYNLSFPTAGTFTFVCTFHQSAGMVGTITVS
jgi:plastocyanin